jgi:hypothetical protein
LGKAHSSMPAPYVEFVRQFWRTQEKESRHIWSRGSVLARQSVFSGLLTSERLSTELRRVYRTPVGPTITQALTCQAVHILELWLSEDKRTKKAKAAQFKKLKTAIKAVSTLLDQDCTMPDEEDATEIAKRSSSKVEARAPRPIPLAFDNLLSEPVVVGRRTSQAIRLRFSVYELNQIMRAFQKPIDDSSAFVMAIYPDTKDEVADYKAINRICAPRRKLINKVRR